MNLLGLILAAYFGAQTLAAAVQVVAYWWLLRTL